MFAGKLLRRNADHPALRPFIEQTLFEEEVVAALLRRDLLALCKVLELKLVHMKTGGGAFKVEQSEFHGNPA